jgi:molecular chaperone GrpE (heat shock protein)
MELQERDRTIAELKATVARERDTASSHVEARVAAQMSPLMEEVAAPVAQLHTQAHLLRDAGKPVRAEDILVVAERLVRALEAHGLTTEGAWGAIVPFDPNVHAPLSAQATIRPGDPVIVRFVGIRYQGALVRKAGVAPTTE